MKVERVFGGMPWVVTAAGVVPMVPMRTRGAPHTMRAYLRGWGDHIRAAAAATGTPVPILMMVIATENGPAVIGPDGAPRVRHPAIRCEPGYVDDATTPHRVSIGPCHVLIETARRAMGRPGIDREWLRDPANNIRAAATYIAGQRARTDFDPIRVAAAYNAGGLYDASSPASRYHNRWHLRAYGDHLDRAARWYGDAVAVVGASD